MLSAVEGTRELRPGLWCYEAFHPVWRRPVMTTVWWSGDDVVLFDPLIPGEPARAEALWAALDAAVAGDRRLAVLLTVFFHGRSAPAIAERYAARGVPVLAPADAVRRLPFGPVTPFLPDDDLPAGVRAVATPRTGEVVFYRWARSRPR